MLDRNRNRALLIFICVVVALALVTLLPLPGSKVNDLGYGSICTYAPWSTLTLLLAAGVIWAVRRYLLTRL
jgi:hypothetical protein